MKLIWDEAAWEDYVWWQQQDRKVLNRINILITDIQRNGNEGIGKPEPLKHRVKGARCISDQVLVPHQATVRLLGVPTLQELLCLVPDEPNERFIDDARSGPECFALQSFAVGDHGTSHVPEISNEE